ncbi:MAG TPA: cation:proton antiporter [Nocardioides sp.]|uniref:cation:proton antiporter n=1 Tax=Nocardioides sp. TaxID=35761 RepID=UPI002E35D34D|nr:cation:proton antiporter [Nocardioides sp.]HEX5090009.1 cation:proton antiporter [Nocardioides sp.]
MSIESLFWISLVAVVAPLVSGAVPRRLVPEVVLLLVLGVVIGPFGIGLAEPDEAIDMLSDLGLAMLFLQAGFEIDPAELTGSAGRRAMWTWLTSLAVAFGLVALLDAAGLVHAEVALAIALTSTALGTLLPILKDGGLLGRPVGEHVLRHGAVGELGPIVAIALLLGTRGPIRSLVVLAAFAAFALLVTVWSLRLQRRESQILELIRRGAETTGQTTVRVTMLLLVSLLAVATAFHLDIVLAAFAAGFILRIAIPEGDEHLEARLEGIAFGLLVPIFFVHSGMGLDPQAIVDEPGAFVAVIVLILVARGLPVLGACRLERGPSRLTDRDGLAVALFSSTGLPIIVAVTSVAVSAGQMTGKNASVLVGAGAATVLLCPLLATLVMGRTAPEAAQRGEGDATRGTVS